MTDPSLDDLAAASRSSRARRGTGRSRPRRPGRGGGAPPRAPGASSCAPPRRRPPRRPWWSAGWLAGIALSGGEDDGAPREATASC